MTPNSLRAARYRKRRALEGPQSVPPGPVVEHIRILNREIGLRRIAELAGVSYHTIGRLLRGDVIAVNKSTAERILAVIPEPGPRSRVSIVPTRRRIGALMLNGWSITETARRGGMVECQVSRMLRQPYITAQKARQMAVLTDQLSREQPPSSTPGQKRASTYAKRLARERGYRDWIEWDDIDDPNEKPKRAPAKGSAGPVLKKGDVIRSLYRQGVSRARAAELACANREVVNRIYHQMDKVA